MSSVSTDVELVRLKEKVDSLRRQRSLLLVPLVLLTFPISVPLIIIFALLRRRKSASAVFEIKSEKTLLAQRNLSEAMTSTQDVLIWCPIAVAGLTTQLMQLTEILRTAGVQYKISYHTAPNKDHPEFLHWIDRKDIRNPRVVFFMERYEPFEVGFLDSFHVYYVNLDWLSNRSVAYGRVYADLVMAPTPYKFREIQELFSNSRVVQQSWPPIGAIEAPTRLSNDRNRGLVRILYVGNDYDKKSRKNPFAVIDAIIACERSDLIFDLKFRKRLPEAVRQKLEACALVDRIVDHPVTNRHMEKLYREADLNLIPNESEGNGLSIIESFAKGVVPAVLDGHPMKDVVTKDTGYFIACTLVGSKEMAPRYSTTAQDIQRLLTAIDLEGIRSRKAAIERFQEELAVRETDLENLVRDVLAANGLLTESRDSEKSPEDDASSVFTGERFASIRKPTKLIDVYLTTSQRPEFLAVTLPALLEAIAASPYDHRLTVMIDGRDDETARILETHRASIHQCFWSTERMGLPYAWNNILDLSANISARSERVPDFICYIQDDCLIADPASYFQEMVWLAKSIDPARLGFVSGFHTCVHGGFARLNRDGRQIVLSDSIDGKNFLAVPKTLYRIGKLTWWFEDGRRRGSPGPKVGSHFDLWQWNESPTCLRLQNRICAILPGACQHLAAASEQSTWMNDNSEKSTQERVSKGNIYRTR